MHALFENGQLGPADLETHIKDEVEREETKISEMSRRTRQAYKEVVSVATVLRVRNRIELTIQTTAPVIEDDMMFADNGEMLLECVLFARVGATH